MAAKLEEEADGVKDFLGQVGGGVDVVVFASMADNTDGPLKTDELSAMRLVLQYSAEVQPLKTEVLYLDPWTAWQDGVQKLLKTLGFPTPDGKRWIEQGGAWSPVEENVFMFDLLWKREGDKESAAAALTEHFQGHPAYGRFRKLPSFTYSMSAIGLADYIKGEGTKWFKSLTAELLH